MSLFPSRGIAVLTMTAIAHSFCTVKDILPSIWIIDDADGCHAAPASINSGRDFRQAMYWQQYSRNGCIRLLNSTHQLGCSSQGNVEAPIQAYGSATLPLEGERVLLVEEGRLGELLDHNLTGSGLAGVLVSMNGASMSVEGPRTWDEATRLLWREFPLPVQAALGKDMERFTEKAEGNAAMGFKGALHTATLNNGMSGEHNSSHCLRIGQCDPLGGHSVWAAMPPFAPGTTGKTGDDLPITLVVAQMDGVGLFHDLIWGADAPISGLVAMLVAAEILGNSTLATGTPQRRLVFVALSGEPWGNQGSKRLLWELRSGENSTEGLDLSKIDQVLELGQVGRTMQDAEGKTPLFFHGTQGHEARASSFWETVKESAQTSSEVNLRRSAANVTAASGPRPSSLPAFLRSNASIDGALLAEHDTLFTNPYYGTPQDNLTGINHRGIADAATLAAQSLFALVATAESLKVDRGGVDARVRELMACMATPHAVLDCEAASKVITRTGMVSNYVGVLHTLTSDSQDGDVNVKNDMSRFVWNTLASATASGSARLAAEGSGGCDGREHACEGGAVCVNYRIDRDREEGNGKCLFASARYVPSYSTAIRCKDCTGESWGSWVPSQEAEQWEREAGWPPDPIWTESRWADGIPSMMVFQKESAKVESRVLLAGILVTLLAYCLYLLAAFAQRYRLKQH